VAKAPGPAVFPAATAFGAILLLVSDVVAQHAFPVFLPLGVVTPILGGPYFLYLLLRINRRQEVT
jgi:iron complex transport system permease protein